MPNLDQMIYTGVGVTPPAPAMGSEEQAKHAASPNDYSFSVSAIGIVGVLAGTFGLIYALTLVERWMGR